MAGLGPTSAIMPVADHIDNAPRSVTFNPVASAGPFSLPFPIYEADSAAELKSDFLIALDDVVQTDYTVAGTFTDGVAIDGAITFGSPLTGELVIYSRRRPRSSVDLADGQAVTSLELQAIVNGLLASVRDVYDWLGSLEAGNVLPAGTFVPTAGGVMSGFLTLNDDPTDPLHAAPKQYVDAALPATTKGDLIGHAGAAAIRVPVAANGKKLMADSALTPGLGWARNGGSVQTLTDTANIAWDMDLGDDAKVTLAGNRTLTAPTNEVVGQFGYLDVIQDATGSRTLTWNAAYKFPNGTDQKPCPDIGSTTRYLYEVRAADDIIIRKAWVSARDSIGWWKEYDKGVLALSTIYTQAHGLGRLPALVQFYLECTTASNGYVIGDRIDVHSLIDGTSNSLRAGVAMNITNAYVAQSSGTPNIMNLTTGAQAALTLANWKVIIRVYE